MGAIIHRVVVGFLLSTAPALDSWRCIPRQPRYPGRRLLRGRAALPPLLAKTLARWSPGISAARASKRHRTGFADTQLPTRLSDPPALPASAEVRRNRRCRHIGASALSESRGTYCR